MESQAQTAFSLKCKELIAEELSKNFKSNPNFVVTNFFGISSNDLNELRKELRKLSSQYFVIKNKLALRALDSAKFSDIRDFINGGVGIGFINGDIVETTKRIVDFAKGHKPFQIKGAYIDGQKLDTDKVKELASLPSREALLTMVVTAMQAPISGFVSVLNGVIRALVYALNAIKDKKEKSK